MKTKRKRTAVVTKKIGGKHGKKSGFPNGIAKDKRKGKAGLEYSILSTILSELSQVTKTNSSDSSLSSRNRTEVITTSQTVTGVSAINVSNQSQATSTQAIWAKGTGFGASALVSSQFDPYKYSSDQFSQDRKLVNLLSRLCCAVRLLCLRIQNEVSPANICDERWGRTGGSAKNNVEIFRQILTDSCLLPLLARYLSNDSLLDVGKHIEPYRALFEVIRMLAREPLLWDLLQLPLSRSDASPITSCSTHESGNTISSLLSGMQSRMLAYWKQQEKEGLVSPLPNRDLAMRTSPVSATRKSRRVELAKLELEQNSLLEKLKLSGCTGCSEMVLPSRETVAVQEEEMLRFAIEVADEVAQRTREVDGGTQATAERNSDESSVELHNRETRKRVGETLGAEEGESQVDLGDTSVNAQQCGAEMEYMKTMKALQYRELESFAGYHYQPIMTLGSNNTYSAHSGLVHNPFGIVAASSGSSPPAQGSSGTPAGTHGTPGTGSSQPSVKPASSPAGLSLNTRHRIKRIAQEHADLSRPGTLPLSLGSSVWMVVNEDRMDWCKAMISGPSGTPYENGLFVFDILLPNDYPYVPPKVNLQTTGYGSVRFNPNLYNCGKVCLSLLGTWSGSQGETWNERTSTLLQVLVSIQSLIFVADPYFNEPGYETIYNTPSGYAMSRQYNESRRVSTIQYGMIDYLERILMKTGSIPSTNTRLVSLNSNHSPYQSVLGTSKSTTSGGTGIKSTHHSVEFEEVIRHHFRIKKSEILDQVHRWQEESRVSYPGSFRSTGGDGINSNASFTAIHQSVNSNVSNHSSTGSNSNINASGAAMGNNNNKAGSSGEVNTTENTDSLSPHAMALNAQVSRLEELLAMV